MRRRVMRAFSRAAQATLALMAVAMLALSPWSHRSGAWLACARWAPAPPRDGREHVTGVEIFAGWADGRVGVGAWRGEDTGLMPTPRDRLPLRGVEWQADAAAAHKPWFLTGPSAYGWGPLRWGGQYASLSAWFAAA